MNILFATGRISVEGRFFSYYNLKGTKDDLVVAQKTTRDMVHVTGVDIGGGSTSLRRNNSLKERAFTNPVRVKNGTDSLYYIV